MTLREHEPAIKAVNPSTKAKINIDPEIQSLIPILKPDELAKLRESILEEGCRDPLIVWKDHGLLLDGHNRYAICKELGKPYSVREKEFPDKDHAMIWILKNQLGRRNLSDYQFNLIVGKEYELEKKVRWGGDRKSETVKENQLRQSDGDDSQKETAERLAKEHKISPRTVERSSDLLRSHQTIQQAAPEVARKLETEEIKAPQKDVKVVGKALQLATPEQKEQIVSELKKDFKKATKTAKEIAVQSKPENLSPEPEEHLDDGVGDIRSNSDLDALLMLADRMCCPKCGKKARLVLKWSCCGLSIDKAMNRADQVKKNICLGDSAQTHAEEQRFEGEEHAGTPSSKVTKKVSIPYSEMASWVPYNKSTCVASKIHSAFVNLLEMGEAPRLDSLVNMANLPEEKVRDYLGKAAWVRKDDSSSDGIVRFLPIDPSGAPAHG